MSVSSCCCHSGSGDGNQGSQGSSETGGTSTSVSGSSSAASSTTDQAISQMEAAFDQAIQTNAKITSIKTERGSVETLAQQRPNIG